MWGPKRIIPQKANVRKIGIAETTFLRIRGNENEKVLTNRFIFPLYLKYCNTVNQSRIIANPNNRIPFVSGILASPK